MARLLKKPWHESFLECVSPHTDAPENFILWSALSLIGATMKNNVFFEIGTYTLYPNQFIVLVAPPGIGKGTVMNLVDDLIKESKPTLVNTLSDRITAEKIIERIADGWSGPMKVQGQQLLMGNQDHNCIIFSTELRVLLGASEWMLEFLEEAWSKTTFDYQTKNKGSVSITSMCCSLLAASVPDFLRNVKREASMVITGGFSSRCLFIYAENASKDLPWPQPLKKNPKSKALYDNLAHDLHEIAALRGEFKVDPSARIMFERFLIQNRASVKDEDSEAISNFRARVKAHVLKLAMVLSASRGDSLIITDIDMGNAITEINQVIVTLEKLFRGAGDSIDAAITARVHTFIEKRGQSSRKEIMRALHRHIGSMENLDRILWVLESIGFITKITLNKQEVYRYVTGRKP
ncbi:MAG: DUF3987 domain-containing protein [Sulfuriferula sp.]|nr:DUF3987 domain-containing protein [Sulfuriferula sp.]